MGVSMIEQVVLVNQDDVAVGVMEKMEAHRRGLLHRAVSVFIFNTKGEWLLQRRARSKYHSNSLWTNTCCTHPYPEETYEQAANRRLNQEMGLEASLEEAFDFIYKEELDNEFTEHELDHVFVGVSDSVPTINLDEVMEYRYISYDDLLAEVDNVPDSFTYWFKKIMNEVFLRYNNNENGLESQPL
jgi:isopentenyl-diphosphate Delta-isomerase